MKDNAGGRGARPNISSATAHQDKLVEDTKKIRDLVRKCVQQTTSVQSSQAYSLSVHAIEGVRNLRAQSRMLLTYGSGAWILFEGDAVLVVGRGCVAAYAWREFAHVGCLMCRFGGYDGRVCLACGSGNGCY